ncbi:MAG: dTMP kinase [Deltaproteobacteria bacterium]|nr:dTMP kinase [Deltaproteobacteria bacterium]
MSLFITFEGGEGGGKSIQAKALLRKLSDLAVPVLLTHEPGGTPFGERMGRWLKWAQDVYIAPLTELMLFNACRAQLVAEVIQPNLKGGKVVICDRYADSTTAYQGYGRELDLAMVKATNKAATQGLKPNLTILLDIPVEEGLARKMVKKQDRFEQDTPIFHQKVREGYLELAAAEPRRWLVVDASQSRQKIADIIWQRVSRSLAKGRNDKRT